MRRFKGSVLRSAYKVFMDAGQIKRISFVIGSSEPEELLLDKISPSVTLYSQAGRAAGSAGVPACPGAFLTLSGIRFYSFMDRLLRAGGDACAPSSDAYVPSSR